ncbi:hypothetical protein Bhyg_16923 [Pseudolycoriella hygida]|uniref:Tyr recombinase domain-containing protein n=1 Tax=Pseudolycoriella hygida TaxID=35572 RepID=A0A9Q0MKL4_9DIPT|nr:hypothetical protein Bhyg_16923 [Pseudolycoriella hygida]
MREIGKFIFEADDYAWLDVKTVCIFGLCHAFRRTSASFIANSGEGMEMVQRIGGWASAKVAAGYIESFLNYKNRTGNTILFAVCTTAELSSSATATSITLATADTTTAEKPPLHRTPLIATALPRPPLPQPHLPGRPLPQPQLPG